LVVDAHGVPLATKLTGANRHDVTQLLPLIEAIPPIRGKSGAPLGKPKSVMADRAHHSEPHRMALSAQDVATEIARRNTTHGSGLGVYRWYVEQSLALMHQFKRLRLRDDRDDAIHEDFMTIACAIMCWRKLHSSASFF
jgi:transposase